MLCGSFGSWFQFMFNIDCFIVLFNAVILYCNMQYLNIFWLVGPTGTNDVSTAYM